ncbi:unnamed protein product [Schistocephalus solidus]|uniref:RRM domain-containing protein n=1 Tax=Schistocephalus solidus TaxID=70667 RepID=A0A183SVU4_SCHSO|nr:unnamed protein product [Schistocephalus solidus]
MMDNRTGRSRGFGYVKFKEPSAVDQVLAEKIHIIDNKEVDPKKCNINMRGKNRRSLKIFVGGIAFEHDEETIRNFFQTFGTVTDVNLLSNPGRQRHRGFAFVGFDDEEVVKKLIKMHYANLNGKQVEIKPMEPPNLQKPSGFMPLHGGLNPQHGTGRPMELGTSGRTQQNPGTGTLPVDQCPRKDHKISLGTPPYGVDQGLAMGDFRTMDIRHLFRTPPGSRTVWVGEIPWECKQTVFHHLGDPRTTAIACLIEWSVKTCPPTGNKVGRDAYCGVKSLIHVGRTLIWRSGASGPHPDQLGNTGLEHWQPQPSGPAMCQLDAPHQFTTPLNCAAPGAGNSWNQHADSLQSQWGTSAASVSTPGSGLGMNLTSGSGNGTNLWNEPMQPNGSAMAAMAAAGMAGLGPSPGQAFKMDEGLYGTAAANFCLPSSNNAGGHIAGSDWQSVAAAAQRNYHTQPPQSSVFLHLETTTATRSPAPHLQALIFFAASAKHLCLITEQV